MRGNISMPLKNSEFGLGRGGLESVLQQGANVEMTKDCRVLPCLEPLEPPWQTKLCSTYFYYTQALTYVVLRSSESYVV